MALQDGKTFSDLLNFTVAFWASGDLASVHKCDQYIWGAGGPCPDWGFREGTSEIETFP